MTEESPPTILSTVKKVLGIQTEDTSYDTDLIFAINTAFMTLQQLGVGPSEGFYLTDGTEAWSAYLEDSTILSGAKSYVVMKSKMLFDPPQSGPMIDAVKVQLAELEFRLAVGAEPPEEETETEEDE